MRTVNAAALLVLSCFLSLAQAVELRGIVVSISDGDTITVLDDLNQQHKVRLSGIDAPEKKQAYGERSRQHLASLVFQREVLVEWNKLDRYKRYVGKVWVNGTDANLEQVKQGFAWWYEKYSKEQPPEDRFAYAQAQKKAKELKRGLWIDKEPTPPWEFRKAISQNVRTVDSTGATR